MQVIHLGYVDLDWSCHNCRKLKIFMSRNFEKTWNFGGDLRVFVVQSALEFYDWDCCVFYELYFRYPALVFIFSQLLIYLLKQQLIPTVHSVLVHSLVVITHAAV